MIFSSSWHHSHSINLKFNPFPVQNLNIVQKYIIFFVSSHFSPISTNWLTFVDIRWKLQIDKSQLQHEHINVKELRTQHLIQRASAMNLENKLICSKTIMNIQKIEQLINMWKIIKYLTLDTFNSSLQTIDIPVDKVINWRYIRKTQLIMYCHWRPIDHGASYRG